jgi:hypothetical protein
MREVKCRGWQRVWAEDRIESVCEAEALIKTSRTGLVEALVGHFGAHSSFSSSRLRPSDPNRSRTRPVGDQAASGQNSACRCGAAFRQSRRVDASWHREHGWQEWERTRQSWSSCRCAVCVRRHPSTASGALRRVGQALVELAVLERVMASEREELLLLMRTWLSRSCCYDFNESSSSLLMLIIICKSLCKHSSPRYRLGTNPYR